MIRINKLILSLLLITSLSSCGVFKSVFKKSEKTKEKTEVVVSKEETSIEEDKSVTVITEKAKGTIITPEKKIEAETTPLSDLKDISDLLVLSSDLVDVRQTYDTLSKKLKTYATVKSRNLDYNIDKTTTTNNNIRKENNSKLDSTSKTEIKKKVAEKQKEPKNIFWFVILGIGVVSVFGYFSYRYFKK